MSETPSPFPLAPLSKEQINSDPTARREAMRRLVRLVDDTLGHKNGNLWPEVITVLERVMYFWPRELDEVHQCKTHEWYGAPNELRELLLNYCFDTEVIKNNESYPKRWDEPDHNERAEQLNRYGIPDDSSLIMELIKEWELAAEHFIYWGIAYANTGNTNDTNYAHADAGSALCWQNTTLPPLSPDQLTKEDIYGFLIFGGLHPDQIQHCTKWWQGHNKHFENIIDEFNVWFKEIGHALPGLETPPPALIASIEKGEVSYIDACINTAKLVNLFNDYNAERQEQLAEHQMQQRLKDNNNRAFITQCCGEQLIYNPHGIKDLFNEYTADVDHEKTGLLAPIVRWGENTLAQHMLAHTTDMELHNTQDLLNNALQHASLETTQAIYAKLLEDDPGLLKTLKTNLKTEDNSFYSVISGATSNDDIEKIRWLMKLGLDPMIAPKNQLGLVNEVLEVCENFISYASELIERGLGYISDIEIDDDGDVTSVHYTSLYSQDGEQNRQFSDFVADQQQTEEFLHFQNAVIDRFKDIIPGLIQAHPYFDEEAGKKLPLYRATPVTIDNLQTEDVLQYHGAGLPMQLLCANALWAKREDQLFALHQQLPSYIQEKIAQAAFAGLIIGGMKHAPERSMPLSDWSARVTANNDHAPAQAIAMGGV